MMQPCETSYLPSIDFDLREFFQGSATPEREGAHTFYYLVQPHMSWATFLSLCDQSITDLQGWKSCRSCAYFWKDVSCLSDANGNCVYLNQDPDSYPVVVRAAVRAYQQSFSNSAICDQVLFCPNIERHQIPDLGRETLGADSITGHSYHHVYLKTHLNTFPRVKHNEIIHQMLPLLVNVVQNWAPDVIDTILSRYKTQGQDAPGYKVNYHGLCFLNQLQVELKNTFTLRESQLVTLKHLIRLTSGEHPLDALGGIHIFSSGSNLSACRTASSEESFWSILQSRYNPTVYRQPTSTPTEGQIKAALHLVDGDTTCFEREYLSTTDPRVTNRAVWRFIPTDVDMTRISAEDLLARAVKKCKIGSAPATCFDKSTPSTGVLQRSFTVDEFEAYLRNVNTSGTTLEWQVHTRVTPVQVGAPVNQSGRDKIKIDASWVLPGSTLNATCIGISTPWVHVPLVVPHVSRWAKPREEHQYGVSTRENALVADGLILQIPHTWAPDCSCLFAEFFTGDMHALGVVRQELHRTLRIRKPDDLATTDIFRGVLLAISMTASSSKLGLVSKLSSLETFRLTYRNGQQELLLVS